MDDCFHAFKIQSVELEGFVAWFLNYEKEINWTKHFDFDAIQLPQDFLKVEPLLAAVHEVHPIKSLGLLKVPAKTMYNWHTDDYRLSCINLLVNKNHNSHTLFGKQKDSINKDIIELKYKPKTFYLFNNQVEHCVINLDVDRYLFSLYFEDEIAYPAIKQKLLHLLEDV